MIGDTLTLPDNHTLTGSIPDHTSETVVLTKVNQDAFGSEYRYRGATYDFKVLVRNSVEAPRKDGVVLNRHNVELQATLRPTVDGTVPAAVPYIASVTIRSPSLGSSADMKAFAGTLAKLIGAGTILDKLDNFES
nr:MAG: putative coat protein [Leviviridae sp.]